MEERKSRLTTQIGIAATVVSLLGGSIALWDKFKPEQELPDLSGRWTITNTVTSSMGDRYTGDEYVYSVGVTETASHDLSGTGEQTRYNAGPAPSRFPIVITDGKHTEQKVMANFNIEGNREFTGTIWLTRSEEDPTLLTGTFEYTAGGTQGTSVVRIK